MNYDEDWPDHTMEDRRELVRKTIRPASIEELTKLGEEHFTVATDPWCERYNELLKTHPTAKFYHAQIPGGAEVVYCRDTETAMWFLEHNGMGIVQPKGLQALKEIVDAL